MTARGALSVVLEDARRLGFLGPDPVERHIAHAEAWAEVLEADQAPSSLLDLGSGGGIPGLVLALRWPGSEAVLLDSQLRRTAWLRTAVGRLGIGGRVSVAEGRAETLGHDLELRERFPLVVARSFGAPAITAELGSAFVTPGGELSVSEPPGSDHDRRWPEAPLGLLGLGKPRQVVREGGSFVILQKDSVLVEGFPRRQNLLLRDPVW